MHTVQVVGEHRAEIARSSPGVDRETLTRDNRSRVSLARGVDKTDPPSSSAGRRTERYRPTCRPAPDARLRQPIVEHLIARIPKPAPPS
jgi:hypothetical protein